MSTWLSRTELYLFNSGAMAEGDDQVQGHLRNLNVHRSMGLNRIHPQVQRELTEEVAKPFSSISVSYLVA